MSNGKISDRKRPVVTSYEAAKAVRMQKPWQEKYQAKAKEIMQMATHDQQFTVAIVGRSGVGKGSLVNHLLQRKVAPVSHNATGNDVLSTAYAYGRLRLLDIPGYDGQHAIAVNDRRKKLIRRTGSGSGSGSGSGKSKMPEGELTLEEFVDSYKLFGNETNAIIFVVNNRITVHDRELMAMAVASRKFFCIVRTNADSMAHIDDCDTRIHRLSEMEREIRDELDLTKDLDIRIMKVSIPWPESRSPAQELVGADRHQVMRNVQVLDFPLLVSYLSNVRGLYGELKIHGVVEVEVARSLEQYVHVKKRRMLLEFCEKSVVGVLLPILGPVMLTFATTLVHTIRALGAVGLVEDPEKAVDQLVSAFKRTRSATQVASKHAMVEAIEDTLIKIFGTAIVDISIYDLAILSAETSAAETLPLFGAALSTVRMPKNYRKIGDMLHQKACMLHELWIMQNVTNLVRLSD